MEKSLEKFYTRFEPPPLAPIYYPTEEEFNDPILYVAKIKSEAERFGICKIVPPSSFRPPFSIQPENFEFTPRLQKLNELDALFRLRLIFINKLVNFWSLQGQHFRLPWTENKYIDMHRLRQLVKEYGGAEQVSRQKRWCQIAKVLGFKPTSGPLFKQHYMKWIYPYELGLGNDDDEDTEEIGLELLNTSAEDISSRPSCSKQQETRMMAGLKRQSKPLTNIRRKNLKIDLETVMCDACDGGDDEHLLLLCDSCDRSLHTYCLTPALTQVPKGEWRCPKCVAHIVKNATFEFGFSDSQTVFNLNTFGNWSNNFKRNYFKQNPQEVPTEKVEVAFWQNVIDLDTNVQVKYGADLISSKVGSGFPRKEDSIPFGIEENEHNLYVNHPWNLNNLPVLKESVLSHIGHGISGMMVPWCYVGMCFSCFCWHVEDHWTYSINFNHWGEKKIWYGIPGSEAEVFDQTVQKAAPELFITQPDLLHSLTTIINPQYLINQGISVYTVHQAAGEFVITFPRSYHSGFNEGLNFAEAVNFAPPDWLHMGRLCLTNYASIKRTCVFSHEELVMRIVSVYHKISLTMCIAALDELRYIVTRETEFRKKLSLHGLCASHFCKFETVNDDARSCQVCRKTLYISALVCRHENRVVCSDHINQLCYQCRIEHCSLKYRYTLSELVALVRKLSERTESFDEWRMHALSSYNNDADKNKKINVRELRELADIWRTRRYPQCDEIRMINKQLNKFEKILTPILKITNRKVRLRDNTRCQKADTRPDFSEVERLQQLLHESEFFDEELDKSLKELIVSVNKWQSRVRKVIDECNDVECNKLDFLGDIITTLKGLISEADEFNLKVLEYGELKSEISRFQWLINIDPIIKNIHSYTNRTSPNQKELINRGNELTSEDSRNFASRHESIENSCKVNLNQLGKALAEGYKWSQTSPPIKKHVIDLEEILTIGLSIEEKAQKFLSKSNAEGIGYEEACSSWKELEATQWLDSENFTTFREEIELSHQATQTYKKLKHDGFTLKMLEQALITCERSLFERNGNRHQQLRLLFDQLKQFDDRVSSLFQKDVNYYNLFDVIGGRSDLPALIEGDSMPLTLFTSSRYSDNWKQLRLFSERKELEKHLNAIFNQHSNLLMALRLINRKRSIRETCLCAQERRLTEDRRISCFICAAAFHETCAHRDTFFEQLMPGVFFCLRCLRSRRPAIQDVEQALGQAPEDAWEKRVLENLLEHSTKAFAQLRQEIESIQNIEPTLVTEGKKFQFESALLSALSMEIWDPNIYSMLFQLLTTYFDILPLSTSQIQAWCRIQERVNSSSPRPVIFSSTLEKLSTPTSTTGTTNSRGRRQTRTVRNGNNAPQRRSYKRSIASTNSSKKEIFRKNDNGWITNTIANDDEEDCLPDVNSSEIVYHRDTEVCAASEKCLRPYNEYVRWIQCDNLTCARWYHYICVGQTVALTSGLSHWRCGNCVESSPSGTKPS